MPVPWRLLFGVIWLVFGVVYFVYALAPESSPDGSTYHLGLVARYARERGFPAIWQTISTPSLPEGLECCFCCVRVGAALGSSAGALHVPVVVTRVDLRLPLAAGLEHLSSAA
jgi:hypothetical protein